MSDFDPILDKRVQQKIADFIYREYPKNHISLYQFSLVCHVDEKTIRNIKTGERSPKLRTLILISKALGYEKLSDFFIEAGC